MSKKIEINDLDDIKALGSNIESFKKDELVKIVRSVQKLVKKEHFEQINETEEAEDYPYLAVSAVQNRLYKLKFDPVSKKARVTEELTDDRGPHMAFYLANTILQNEIKKQTKEKK